MWIRLICRLLRSSVVHVDHGRRDKEGKGWILKLDLNYREYIQASSSRAKRAFVCIVHRRFLEPSDFCCLLIAFKSLPFYRCHVGRNYYRTRNFDANIKPSLYFRPTRDTFVNGTYDIQRLELLTAYTMSLYSFLFLKAFFLKLAAQQWFSSSGSPRTYASSLVMTTKIAGPSARSG